MPDTITSIGDSAFYGNKIETLEIPNSVTSMGEAAFSDNLISELTIGTGLTEINREAFQKNRLTQVIIPNNVETIGFAAFESNDITHLSIPKNVKFIADQAFNLSRCLESVTFEGNPELGEHIFESCRNLKIMIVRNEEMKQHLYETGNVPEGCEVKVIEKELEQSQDDELTPLEDINLAPDVESLRKECDEIMNSKEEFVYDEVDQSKKDAR
jgi:hypothetical protein